MIDDLIDAFRSKIVHSNTFVIVPHHNPDGDALGSALGLNAVLLELGKDSRVITPSAHPSFLNWMVGADEIINFEKEPSVAKQYIDTCEVLVIVDFNSIKRVKGMSGLLQSCSSFKIMIDHHPFPDVEAANLMMSNTAVSSTCELIYEILKKAGLTSSLSAQAASCFYAGIMTDTGMLSHNSSRPETYHVVADLVAIGIEKDEIHKLVFHSNSLSRMQLLGYCLLEKMQVLPQLEAAYISLSKEELARFNFQPGDTEGFVNYPLGIEGINVSALFMEQEGKVKVSLRSRGNVAVNLLSEECFNGGGHHNAAGGESSTDMNQTIKTYVEALPKYLEINKQA
jgi:phosphoesterase RecJ-like protein